VKFSTRLCLCLAATLALCGPAQALTLSLKASCSVTGNNTVLGDVAEIMGDAPSDLITSELGASPVLGTERTWDRTSIQSALVSKLPSTKIDWQGADRCVVKRPARTLTQPDLVQALEKQLREATSGIGQVHVEEASSQDTVLVPEGDYQMELTLSPTALNNAWATATLRISSMGETASVKALRFRWSWMQSVWQTTRDIALGEMITHDTLKQISMNTLQRRQALLLDSEYPRDAIAGRSLRTGSILLKSDLKSRDLVKKGTPLRIHYNRGGVEVIVEAVAVQDGAKGQLIQAVNPATRKRFLARVVDDQRAEYVQ